MSKIALNKFALGGVSLRSVPRSGTAAEACTELADVTAAGAIGCFRPVIDNRSRDPMIDVLEPPRAIIFC